MGNPRHSSGGMLAGQGVAFILVLALIAVALLNASGTQQRGLWRPDHGDGTFRNPILFADYSDPDVVRVGGDYYLISSSFECVPGIPILHSKDLVNWRIIGHALHRLPSPRYDQPRHGEGCWAPSLRYHAGRFWVYFGDPDLGVYMTTAANPAGPWDEPVLVKAARGWIDPCPLWDDDGSVYLVHAWAKSRAGFNSVLTVNRLSADGRRVVNDGVDVFKGGDRHPTIEGPKFYKRNGYYYIFAPAGGVKNGWQTVLRSRAVHGPYEDRVVLRQGNTAINGPHQGAWVETTGGESWFIHFQDRGAYGRITHLQPMEWHDDWPVIGSDSDGDGIGEPVASARKPDRLQNTPIELPQTTDEFTASNLGLQWQWEANPSPAWFSLSAHPGTLRLFAIPLPDGSANLWGAPNLLLQKLPAPQFTATARIDARRLSLGDRAGVIVMGPDYAYVAVQSEEQGLRVVNVLARNVDQGSAERVQSSLALRDKELYLRVTIHPGAACQFSFSSNGRDYTAIGPEFTARPGTWVGAKIGLFSIGNRATSARGFADFDWFRVE